MARILLFFNINWLCCSGSFTKRCNNEIWHTLKNEFDGMMVFFYLNKTLCVISMIIKRNIWLEDYRNCWEHLIAEAIKFWTCKWIKGALIFVHSCIFLHHLHRSIFGYLSHFLWGLEFDFCWPPLLPPSLCCPSWQLAMSTSDSAWRWDKLKRDWMELTQFPKEKRKTVKLHQKKHWTPLSK